MDFSRAETSELSLLQQVVFEARFCSSGNNGELWLSPLVADLHESIIEELRRRLVAAEDHVRIHRFDAWLEWSAHGLEREIVAKNLKALAYWQSPDSADRPTFLTSLVRPFHVKREDLEGMVKEIDLT